MKSFDRGLGREYPFWQRPREIISLLTEAEEGNISFLACPAIGEGPILALLNIFGPANRWGFVIFFIERLRDLFVMQIMFDLPSYRYTVIKKDRFPCITLKKKTARNTGTPGKKPYTVHTGIFICVNGIKIQKYYELAVSINRKSLMLPWTKTGWQGLSWPLSRT